MVDRDTPWPAGTPCWVDLLTSDLGTARLFYEQLFGWTFSAVGDPEQTGGYEIATLGGRSVAGAMAQGPDQADHPSVWTVYLGVEDAAKTAEAITSAGGTVLMPVTTVMDAGVMALASDPTGAVFGIWQAKDHTGFQKANEAGSVVWNEAMSRDFATAKTFYASVFGYTYTDMSGGGFEYATIEVNGNTVGGIGALPAEVPAEVPAHWATYFAVDDADESVDAAVKRNAVLIRPAQDMPYGRHAYLQDPTGAFFSIIKPGDPNAG
jgi:predicted enzyme related to lactoylglutathione lyase